MSKKNTPQKQTTQPSNHRRLFWILGFIIILVAIVGGSAAYAHTYTNRIFPGVFIGNVDLGGKTTEEARALLEKTIDNLIANGFVFVLNGKQTVVSPTVFAPTDPDLSRDLVVFDIEHATQQVLAFGHGKNPAANLIEQLYARFAKKTISMPVQIESDEISTRIMKAFAHDFLPVKNAELVITPNPDKTLAVTIAQERTGNTFSAQEVAAELEQSLTQLEHPRITLTLVEEQPNITAREAEKLVEKATRVLNHGPWSISFEKKTWDIDANTFATMLIMEKDEAGNAHLAFGGDTLETFFNDIRKDIDRSPRNAKFRMENNRVVEFLGSQIGIELDVERTKTRMEMAFITNLETTAQLSTLVTEPEVTTAEVNDLGIKEILGIGTSNFRGSPKNRVKNIKNGAMLVNGALVPPGEEFSLLATLRPFTLENGYLPELVIKGNKIQPEIGGGLCQLGTTIFRATMKSGLPVTERSNHSLVVSYYNDPANGNPGTDATIYDPAPDFRFKNDTNAHILITTEVDEQNTELRFIFWGTSDGRAGSYTPPVVTNWIAAGETKYIETNDLAPGKEQCQASHVGANAEFTYIVAQPDGTKKETVYTSHYRALPKTCLVGVEERTDNDESLNTDTLTPDETVDR